MKSDPNSEKNEEARDKLIQVARKMFAKKGFEGVSVRDITTEAEVNLSLVSYYFGGKEGLYRTVVVEHITRAKASLEQIVAEFDGKMTAESFKAEMLKIISTIVKMKLAEPDLHLIVHREMADGFPYLKEVCDQMFKPMAEKVVGVFEQAQKKKIIRNDLNVWVHFITLVHALDMYLLTVKNLPEWNPKLIHLPTQQDKYVKQLYMTFVEGILV